MNRATCDGRSRQHSKVGIHDTRFTQTLLVYVNTRWWWVRDGIQHHRDFWRTLEDAPDALVYASSPPSEDADSKRHAVTLAVVV
jgi:hypothetical protein